MIELVLVYCLAADQTNCVEKRDPLDDWQDPVACMIDAEQRAEVYLESHPKWRLARWKCEINVPREERT